jgi:plasmid stabilization system protein ParE
VGRRACRPEGPPPAAPVAPLSHLVRLSSLAAFDLQQARNWFDAREPGRGDTFLERVNETITRISNNPDQYQLALLDLHRAPVRVFKYSVWYRVLPDSSVVVACLSDRRDLESMHLSGDPGGT